MKLCILLIIALSMATMALAGNKCNGTGNTVTMFNGQKEAFNISCKYHAVRQKCGSYIVKLTPGNVYSRLSHIYLLDSLWLGVKEIGTNNSWAGRTDNMIALKYIFGWKSDLYNNKTGNRNTEDVLKFHKDGIKTVVEAKNGDFRVTFVPWSYWEFECFSENFKPAGYPKQICGGEDVDEVANRVDQLRLMGHDQALYYDILTNTGIAQTSCECEHVTNLMTKRCTDTERSEAMIVCSHFLSTYPLIQCHDSDSCDPVHIMNNCIDWFVC